MPPREDHCSQVIPSTNFVGISPRSSEKDSKELVVNHGGLFKNGKLTLVFRVGFLLGIGLSDLPPCF